jgi:hypothetical protein
MVLAPPTSKLSACHVLSFKTFESRRGSDFMVDSEVPRAR